MSASLVVIDRKEKEKRNKNAMVEPIPPVPNFRPD